MQAPDREVRGSSTALYVVSLDKELYSTLSAYHLYGNFGEKFPSYGTGIFFWHRKQERELVVPFMKYQ